MMTRGDSGSGNCLLGVTVGELMRPDPHIVGVTGVFATVDEFLMIPIFSESLRFLTLAP